MATPPGLYNETERVMNDIEGITIMAITALCFLQYDSYTSIELVMKTLIT